MPAVLDGKLKSAREMIGKGFPITLQDGRAYSRENPSAMSFDEIVHELRFRSYLHVGLFLKGSPFCAVDCDSDDAVAEARRLGLVSNFMVKTRRGVHAIFRHQTEPSNILQFLPKIDVIFNNCIPIPPVILDGFERYFLTPVPHADQLPLLPRWVTPKPKPKPIVPLVSQTRTALVRWINKVEAHMGSGGSNQAFRCACRIAREVEDIREGLAIFLSWNESNAFPNFSERECRHKIEDAYRKIRG